MRKKKDPDEISNSANEIHAGPNWCCQHSTVASMAHESVPEYEIGDS